MRQAVDFEKKYQLAYSFRPYQSAILYFLAIFAGVYEKKFCLTTLIICYEYN